MIINMNGAKAPETPSSVLQEKTVTPETLPTVIGPDEGYDGLTQVTVNPDAQLIPTNIRSGKTVFGVTGSFVGEEVEVPDREGAMWTKVMTMDASHMQEDPVNAPAGVIKGKYLRKNAFDSVYIGPEGLDLSNITSMGSEVCKNLYQYYKDSSGTWRDGGPIKLSMFFTYSNTFQKAYLVRFPVWGGAPDPYTSGGYYIPNYFFDQARFKEDVVVSEGIIRLGNYSFNQIIRQDGLWGASGSAKLILPSTLATIDSNAVSGTSSYKLDLVLKSTSPPKIGSNSLDYIKSILVPNGTLETYQTATNWSKFASIMTEATE